MPIIIKLSSGRIFLFRTEMVGQLNAHNVHMIGHPQGRKAGRVPPEYIPGHLLHAISQRTKAGNQWAEGEA